MDKEKNMQPAKSGIQGQPINVFNSPAGTRRKGTSERNVERIKTLEYAMAKLAKKGMKDSDHYESLRLEHARRMSHYEHDRWQEKRET